MNFIYKIEDFHKLNFKIDKFILIFLFWDLWSWKTTLSKYILKNKFWVKENITSPTYTYYNKYKWVLDKKEIDIYHFDLYRLSNYDEFISIWWEDILDNNNGVILIEWPEIILDYYKANIIININKTKEEDKREIIIT